MGIKVMKEINGKLNMNKNKIYNFNKGAEISFFRSFFIILIYYILYVVYMIQHSIYFIYHIKNVSI